MRPIYLDNAATTPLRNEVRDAMLPILQEEFGNPSSVHTWGRRASARLEEARERVADALGARRGEIYFVRGGTESDNLAVLGRTAAVRAQGGSDHVVVTAIEHRAVLEASAMVAERGGRRTVLSVQPDGTVDLDALEQALKNRPAVVSVMTVNNEVGIHLPVEQLAERTRASGTTLHTDAVQAIGKVPVRVDTGSSGKANRSWPVRATSASAASMKPSVRRLRPGTAASTARRPMRNPIPAMTRTSHNKDRNGDRNPGNGPGPTARLSSSR